MAMRELRIEPKTEGKGRSFSATLVGFVYANSLWDLGSSGGDAIRPVWLSFIASEGEVRPFTANLRLGRRAFILNKGNNWRDRRAPYLEMLRSAEYEYTVQRFPEGVVTTAFLPELFRLDPGMVSPKGATFIVMPSEEWVTTQNVDTRAVVNHIAAIGYIDTGLMPNGKKRPDWEVPSLPSKAFVEQYAPVAPLFAAYLDRRTRAPLIQDARFHTQILIAFLKRGFASLSTEDSYRSSGFGQHKKFAFFESGTDKAGLMPGIAFTASHENIEAVLAEEVSVYLSHV